jgi:GNAT superfamily N-acetyltransferase
MMISGYKFSSETNEMDIAVIHQYIARSYWAKNIPLSIMEKAIRNSLCFGVFTDDGAQVAFARVITDSATFAYLADVFVLEAHRGKGISKWMIENVIAFPNLQGLRRMLLATSDAHGLYEQFGFKALHSPTTFMERHQANAYQ